VLLFVFFINYNIIFKVTLVFQGLLKLK